MNPFTWWPSAAVLAIAAVIDIRTRRVPNWLSIPYLATGLVAHGIDDGWAGIGRSLGGLALAIALFGVPCMLGGMGMGDLKLAAGVGAWIGAGQLLMAFVFTGVVGGIYAVAFGLWRGVLGRSLDNTGDLMADWARFGFRRRSRFDIRNPEAISIPYAPAIAVGTMLSFLTRLPGAR